MRKPRLFFSGEMAQGIEKMCTFAHGYGYILTDTSTVDTVFHSLRHIGRSAVSGGALFAAAPLQHLLSRHQAAGEVAPVDGSVLRLHGIGALVVAAVHHFLPRL